jgi:methylphosphotriester-DNA--protein-cysteine methyltransferase
MIYHNNIEQKILIQELKSKKILFGGNKKLLIYGLLSCKSGKRMKQQNRVFFADEQEAISNGYRPCGHCMKEKYMQYVKNSK